MKDTRFTELVNLYIDRQISAEETAELEAEIQRNPARRRTYQDYCRLHRATRLAYESFRAGAEPASAGSRQPGGIAQIALRARRRRQRWIAAAGGLAAAACVAFVLVGPTLRQTPGVSPAPTATVAAAPAAPEVAPLLELERPVVVFAARPAAEVAADYRALLTTYQAEPTERLLTVEPAAGRVSLFDDGVFAPRPDVLPGRAQPAFAPRRNRAATEFTAFQFQR